MNVKNTRKPQPRVEVKDYTKLGIQAYGADNLYPQHVMSIVAASGTATLCLNRYHKFVEGFGFRDVALSEMFVARDYTLDDLLHQVSRDLCMFNGFAIHADYDALGRIASLHHVPFEMCRKGETDEHGYVSDICVHIDWSGKMYRRGKQVKVTKESIKHYPVFNPNPDIVQVQIEEAGGVDTYAGQILYVSVDKEVYPTPIYDAAITEISTDEGLGNVKYRNVRNNFLVSALMVVKKGAPIVDEHGNEEEQGGIRTEDMEQFQGDTRAGQLMLVEVEDMEDAPKIDKFPAHNFDKEFTATETSTVERIYAQFHQEAFYALRTGRTGFSTENERSAYESYAGEVTYEQRFLERTFNKIFNYWHAGGSYDFTIQPMKYVTINGTE